MKQGRQDVHQNLLEEEWKYDVKVEGDQKKRHKEGKWGSGGAKYHCKGVGRY